ncbi:MAG: lipoprotein-releasing system permease protein, partial [Flavobacteriales bacterium]
KQRILRVVPHALVFKPTGMNDWRADAEILQQNTFVHGSSPYISGLALLGQRSYTRGVELIGVMPDVEKNVSEVDQYIVEGDINLLNTEPYSIVIGRSLAYSLGVSIGDSIVVTLPEISISPAGVFPRTKRFRLVAVFEVGAQVDQGIALIHLDAAQKLFRRGNAVDGLRVRFDDIYNAPKYLPNVIDGLGEDYAGKDWSETQGSLFKAVKLEKTVTGLLLGIIIAVAAFNIVTTLVMMVTEKRSDIAVLRTMGMTGREILIVFVIQGAATGLYGILLGAVIGIPVAIFFPQIVASIESLFGFHIFDPSVFYVTGLPSVWRLSDTLLVCGVAATISCIATLYPSFKASKIEPAEALRYDI